MPFDEFARAVDASLLQDVVAHGDFHHHRNVAARSNGDTHLGNFHPKNVLAELFDFQPILGQDFQGGQFDQVDDQFDVLFRFDRGLAKQ